MMDLLRACYTTEMRFWKDNDTAVPVRWFWCDDDAKDFEGYQRFASGNWASKYGAWDGPGEVEDAPRVFDEGVNPGLDGHKFCGPIDAYREGSAWPGKPLHANAEGLCPCCVPMIVACNVYYGTLPDVLYAKILGITSNMAYTGGTVGETFTLTKNLSGAYASDSYFTVPFFGCGWQVFISCGFAVAGQLALSTTVFFPPVGADTVTLEPFVAQWNLVMVSTDLCSQTYGIVEQWTLQVSENPIP